MYTNDPAERLFIAKDHQRTLHAEAAQARTESRSILNGRRFRGLQVQLGSMLILIGRTLREDEPACPDMAHSMAGTAR